MPFATHEELMNAIENDLILVLESVGEQIVERVKEEVYNVVYAPHEDDVRIYKRLAENGGFLGSWNSEFFNLPNGGIGVKIFSDPSDDFMVVNPEIYVHGHPNESGQTVSLWDQDEIDRRENLDKFIAEGTNWDFFPPNADPSGEIEPIADDGWWTRPRDYFTPVIEELSTAGLYRYFSPAFKQAGMSVKQNVF